MYLSSAVTKISEQMSTREGEALASFVSRERVEFKSAAVTKHKVPIADIEAVEDEVDRVRRCRKLADAQRDRLNWLRGRALELATEVDHQIANLKPFDTQAMQAGVRRWKNEARTKDAQALIDSRLLKFAQEIAIVYESECAEDLGFHPDERPDLEPEDNNERPGRSFSQGGRC
jgi:hypothetical protein